MDVDSVEVLDVKLKALGLTPLSNILKGKPNPLTLHRGVDSLDAFEKWLNMRYEECMRMKAQFIVEGREDDELYEWVLAHAHTFEEVLGNYNQIKKV